MGTTRQDAWAKDEDIILADTVLHYIKEGKTQLEAFKDVAKKLSRTFSACGFRWNATIRKSYEMEIQQAKEERKQKNKNSDRFDREQPEYERDSIENAITLLEKMKKNYSIEFQLTQQEQEMMITRLKQENEYLQEQLQRYEAAWQEMVRLWEWAANEREK